MTLLQASTNQAFGIMLFLVIMICLLLFIGLLVLLVYSIVNRSKQLKFKEWLTNKEYKVLENIGTKKCTYRNHRYYYDKKGIADIYLLKNTIVVLRTWKIGFVVIDAPIIIGLEHDILLRLNTESNVYQLQKVILKKHKKGEIVFHLEELNNGWNIELTMMGLSESQILTLTENNSLVAGAMS
jgi:hypothetical protein